MTVAMMRFIDRYAGIPLCLAAGIWTKIARTRKPSAGSRVKNILVIKLFGMGSVLLSTPFLEAVHAAFPGSAITYLTFSANGALLLRLPRLSRRLLISTASPASFARDLIVVVREVRNGSFDIVFDLEFFSKFSTLLSFVSGAGTRVGFSLPTRWRRWNLTHPVDLDRMKHAAALFLSQLFAVCSSATRTPPVAMLRATERERNATERKLSLSGVDAPVVCVNINAGPASLERRWEQDRFAAVCLSLLGRGARLFLTGSRSERPYVERMLSRHPALRAGAVNCAGLLELGEFIALLEQSRLLITNDSGPMHIAAAVGTPVVALFGPESPVFYGPSGPATIIYKGLECSPCLNAYNAKAFVCPFQARCMKEITPEEVVAAAELHLPIERAACA